MSDKREMFAKGGVITEGAFFPSAMCFSCGLCLEDIRYEKGELWFCKSCARERLNEIRSLADSGGLAA